MKTPRSRTRSPTPIAPGKPSAVVRAGSMPRGFDDYIANAPPFARPILERMRALVHQACPEIVEALKWSHPAFVRGGIVCGMAAFKQHVRIVFWKAKLLRDPKRLFRDSDGKATGVLIVRDAAELPPDEALLDYIRQAVDLDRTGAKVPRTVGKGKAVPRAIPVDLTAALRKNKRAQAGFDAMSTSHRNEYVEWIVTAKQDETRQKRLLTAIEWMSEGKPRHWKYMKK